MALFKILSNMESASPGNLPSTYKQGYCYFDVRDGKLWIDTTDDAAGRMALNAYKADSASKATTDAAGNVIASTYLKLSGGIMTGNLNLGSVSSPTNVLLNISHSSSTDGSKYTAQTYVSGGGTYRVDLHHTPEGGTDTTVNSIKLSATTTEFTQPVNPNSGGTGCKSLQASMNVLINALPVGSTTPIDQDYFISQTVGGGTESTNYNRRPMSTLVTYLRNKDIGNEVNISDTAPAASSVDIWIDTSTDSTYVEGFTYTGPTEPESELYNLWIDTASTAIADTVKYKTFSITLDDWVGNGPYTYTMEAQGISEETAIFNLTLDSASQANQQAQLDWETLENTIILSTATKPKGTIAGYLLATKVVVI